MSARTDSPELFYGFTSPLYPVTIFRYDAATAKSATFAQPKIKDFDPGGVRDAPAVRDVEGRHEGPGVRDDEARARSSTARNPTILYGYGGFDINITPTFSPNVVAWIEQGGIYATANMRGGAEYGEEWHKAGMFEKKQNVFDDFIAAGEIPRRTDQYTSPAKLGIEGGSNGGLLIGAVEEQRPDLFAVALPAVGVMDMLRYDKFTGGQAWAAEYGSSSDSTAFKYLIKYSPLHNVKPGTCYPATLLIDRRSRRSRGAEPHVQVHGGDAAGAGRATGRFSCASRHRARTAICRRTKRIAEAGGSVGVRRRRMGMKPGVVP